MPDISVSFDLGTLLPILSPPLGQLDKATQADVPTTSDAGEGQMPRLLERAHLAILPGEDEQVAYEETLQLNQQQQQLHADYLQRHRHFVTRLSTQLAREVKAASTHAVKNPSAEGAALDPKVSSAAQMWQEYLDEKHSQQDPTALLNWVFEQAYFACRDDMLLIAEKVRFYLDVKKQLREEITRARLFQTQHQQKDANGDLVLDAEFMRKTFANKPEVDEDGVVHPSTPQNNSATQNANELEEYIQSLDRQLSSVGEDELQERLKLQMLNQKMVETISMLSSMSRSHHQAAMDTIRKIGN